MDMAGNVWEWMQNPFQQDKEWRAFRGGSWPDTSEHLRCDARINFNPALMYDCVGFRVVCAQS